MLRGIAYKVASTLVFALMYALVKRYSSYPLSEVVFFRSFFALGVLGVWLGWRGEFPRALYTRRLSGHLLRSLAGMGSMFFAFAAYGLMPLADATAVGYAGPLMIVLLAGLMLDERIGPMRWGAVTLGFVGVLLMLYDQLSGFSAASSRGAVGALSALIGAFCLAIAMIQTRRLVQTEHMGAVIFYFQTTASIAAGILLFIGTLWPASWPFASTVATQGWVMPASVDWLPLIAMGLLGGLGQIFMTRSYVLADASVVACFDYTSMVWMLVLGVSFFSEVPTPLTLIGAGIVMAAGILVILTERRYTRAQRLALATTGLVAGEA